MHISNDWAMSLPALILRTITILFHQVFLLQSQSLPSSNGLNLSSLYGHHLSRELFCEPSTGGNRSAYPFGSTTTKIMVSRNDAEHATSELTLKPNSVTISFHEIHASGT